MDLDIEANHTKRVDQEELENQNMQVIKERKKMNIKPFVRGCYDMQKLRIEIGNRIVANFKVKLGQQPSKKEKTMSKESKFLLSSLRNEYKRITDGAKNITLKNFKGKELISSFAEFVLVRQYTTLLESEEQNFKDIGKLLQKIPIYAEFMADIKGIGPAMAGVIVSELDPHKATYPASFWKYAGLDVAEDGKGRSRKKEHLVEYEYINKNNEKAVRLGITFNPFLKTKLIGVLAPSFLRAGKDNKYAMEYYNYKNRLLNNPKHKDKIRIHIHNMATRYMIKRFLVDLHIKWRELEGLPVNDEYSKRVLGMEHRKGA